MSTLISSRLMGSLLNCTQSGGINISDLELKFVCLIQMLNLAYCTGAEHEKKNKRICNSL